MCLLGLAAATFAAATVPAMADQPWRRQGGWNGGHERHDWNRGGGGGWNNGGGMGGGGLILGLGLGAMLGATLAPQPQYYGRPPVYYAPPPVIYYGY